MGAVRSDSLGSEMAFIDGFGWHPERPQATPRLKGETMDRTKDEETPADVIVGAHAPFWCLHTWDKDSPLYTPDPDCIRRDAWEIIEDLSAALDAHVAAHPGDEWGDGWQARTTEARERVCPNPEDYRYHDEGHCLNEGYALGYQAATLARENEMISSLEKQLIAMATVLERAGLDMTGLPAPELPTVRVPRGY